MSRKKQASTRVDSEQSLPHAVSVSAGGVRVISVRFETTELLELERHAEGVSVDGAIVKLRPTLRSSERSSWDGAAQAARLRELGARAVLLAPVVVPDEGKLTEVATAETPEAAVAAWFDALTGADPADRDAARETALDYLASEKR